MIPRLITRTTIHHQRNFCAIRRLSSTPQKNNSKKNNAWEKLRVPSIFGIGLYFGLVVFSSGDDKQEPALFTEMKLRMIGGDKK